MPKAVVQDGCKRDPSDVGQHETSREVIDSEEDEGCYDDEHPHQTDFHERPAQFLGTEEDRRPNPIEKQLESVESKWKPDLAESTAFVPDSEGGKAHRQVENRPRWEEKLKTKGESMT